LMVLTRSWISWPCSLVMVVCGVLPMLGGRALTVHSASQRGRFDLRGNTYYTHRKCGTLRQVPS
jgi:hypothetical protein